MNAQTLTGSLFTAAVLAFGSPAVAEEQTFSFSADDHVFAPWVSPYDADEEPLGFRLAGPDGFSLTAFGASPYEWQNTTFVLGFSAAPETAYSIDWTASWLEVAGTPIRLTDFVSAPASETGEAWLAAHLWGGNGLTPEATWVFTAPDVDTFSITGGSITYNVTSVPEPEAWAMLLAGLGVIGATARSRAGG
ncbi:MAG: PEPxxWA-CTERM sorting domain-containing protein [Azoarcus sp.]|jgi:hypothetical protein|nr:PEPxxWA-CTERM sorting domain-containing protein [Azoarcus sp.]